MCTYYIHCGLPCKKWWIVLICPKHPPQLSEVRPSTHCPWLFWSCNNGATLQTGPHYFFAYVSCNSNCANRFLPHLARPSHSPIHYMAWCAGSTWCYMQQGCITFRAPRDFPGFGFFALHGRVGLWAPLWQCCTWVGREGQSGTVEMWWEGHRDR